MKRIITLLLIATTMTVSAQETAEGKYTIDTKVGNGEKHFLAYIQDNVALFLTDEDYHRIDSLLAQPGYIDTCMRSVRKMLAFPMSAIAVEAISNDPLNLFSPTLQRLATLSASDAYQMVDGYVFDNEGHAFAFMTSPYPSADTRNNTRLAGLIDNVVQKAMEEVPGVQISAVGAPLIAVTNATQIKKDSFLSIALAFVFIMAILLFAMGHKRNILWLGFSIVAGWLFALGAIALFKPAAQCRVDADACVGCMRCVNEIGCPGLITKNTKATIDTSLCTGCGLCTQICPVNAIE